ncbi:Swa2 [Kluyveromyces lactis]|nr:Swa2 [Kluyveromyces lactis]
MIKETSIERDKAIHTLKLLLSRLIKSAFAMSDPFADLLSSFKGDNSSARNNSSANKNASLNDLLSSHSALTSPLSRKSPSNVPSKTPESISITSMTASQDFFDDILAAPSQVTPLRESPSQVAPPTATEKDDFDLAFESFNSTPHVDLVQPQPDPIPEPQPLVDEVKDMEIARLMSLGLSFDKAVHYYDKGIMYEELIELQKKRKQSRFNVNNDFGEQQLRQEESRDSSPAFISVASNLFNMGKEFIEDRLKPTLQPQSANYSQRSQFSDDIPPRRACSRPHSRPHSRQFQSERTSPQPNPELPSIHQLSINNVSSAPPPVSVENQDKTSVVDQETLVDFGAAPQTSVSPQHRISDFELTSFNEFKNNGVKYFSSGDYHNALLEFEKSFNTLPFKHPLRIISLSNIVSCQLKLGENSKALESVKLALELSELAPNASDIIEHSVPERTYNQMINKIQLKHAEIQEHLENYEKALSLYANLISNGVTEQKVMDGKRRCEKIVNPDKFKPAKEKISSLTIPVRSKTSTISADTVAVNKVKEEIKKQEKEEDERLRLRDRVDEKISKWTKNNEKDLRYLLANLEPLLRWASWKEVSPQDLVMTKKVKICYLKAIAKTHPDKIPADASLETIMIAENVYTILNKAWEYFKSQNNI